jgi:hypothetical protein
VRQITEVISTKRSAHRAFIRWFCQNARRPVAFFNNVAPSAPPRLRELERYDNGISSEACRSTDHVNELLEGETDVIMNLAGRTPSSVQRWNRKFLGPHVSGRLVRVVFLRDPVNTFASLAKRCRPKDFRSVFKYFYQVLALEQIVQQAANRKSNLCEQVVLMAPWLRDENYRADVARSLDLTPAPPPALANEAAVGNAGQTPVPAHERWRSMERNPIFLAPFADPQTAEATRAYFRLFGMHESVDASSVHALERHAANSPEAADYLARFLTPMRRARSSLDAMDSAPQPAMRELWKGVVTTRMMLRI